MEWVAAPFAACAITFVMSLSAVVGVAAADNPASTEGAGSGGTAGGSSSGSNTQSTKATESSSTTTHSSVESTRSAGEPAGETPSTFGAADPTNDVPTDPTPKKDESGSHSGKTTTRAPALQPAPEAPVLQPAPEAPALQPAPEAPPPVSLAPPPAEAPALKPMPLAPAELPPAPADLPPVAPIGPGEPEPVNAAGHERTVADIMAPPVMTAPMVVAPAPVPLTPISGSIGTPRVATRGSLATSRPGASADSTPPLRQHATTQLINGAPVARDGTPRGTEGSRETARTSRVSQTAAEALPGVAGLVLFTAAGVCLGYRQAATGQRLQARTSGRFVT